MEENERWVHLGFVGTKVRAGSHICQIYNDSTEREHALLEFLASGLKAGEKAACFWENLDESTVLEWLEAAGISGEEVHASLSMARADSVYFEGGHFDPDRMLRLLATFHEACTDEGYAGARVIGEMSPRIKDVDGGARLFEYESAVNSLLREHPVTAVCQYNARAFDGATIMDVLSVHPMMIMHGNVIRNPFFIPPEQLAHR